jgi:hypothetical protein
MCSCILHDFERSSSTFGKAEAAEEGRNSLVVTTTRTKEISEFTVLSAEAPGCLMALETAHTLDPALDAAMVLLGSPIANDKSGLARWMER